MYKRKTHDEYEVQGFYFGWWEVLTVEESMADAKQMLKDYNENEVGVRHRIIKKRVRNEVK